VVDARADLLNDAGGLGTKTAGKRRGIEARADVNVHEVHTDGRVAHARLAGAWLANWDGFPHQHFRPAGLMETDSVWHVAAPLGHKRSSMTVGGIDYRDFAVDEFGRQALTID
jgi:hypothetical protein